MHKFNLKNKTIFMKKILLIALVAIGAAACCNCNQAKIEGAWGETSPCQTKKHGIVLNEDGTAKSCIKGLCLATWKQEGDQLILEGKRMPKPHKCHKAAEEGEKVCEKKCEKPCEKKCEKACEKKCDKKAECKKECQAKCEKKCEKDVALTEPMIEPIEFVDTFKIEKLTADSLILVAPCGHKFNFGRIECKKACCDKKAECKKACEKKCDKSACKKENCEKKCEAGCKKANCEKCDKNATCDKKCNKENCKKECCKKAECEKECKAACDKKCEKACQKAAAAE